MPFIRARNVRRDESGAVTCGSAALIDVEYVPGGGRCHSRQVTREKLGKIVELSEDGRSGVFRSPTRGLVAYDADADEFRRVERGDGTLADESREFPEPAAHAMFGDAWLLLDVLSGSGLLEVLAEAFPDGAERERLLCHLLHSVLRDGSRIGCDDFLARSAASHLLAGCPARSTRTDTAYFSRMGADAAKVAFFRALVAAMRAADPSFGTACYVDSTPLPNGVSDNPFNALSCHGVAASSVQCRLVMVLDEASGIPVWYDVIPGNVLDVSTFEQTCGDVEATLGVTVCSAVLDAGYVTKALLRSCAPGSGRSVLARMPARRGFPFKEMWGKVKGQVGRGKYAFARGGHAYFGRAFDRELFGVPARLFVYVDKENALARHRQLMAESPERWEAMSPSEKDWEASRGGFFVLVSCGGPDEGPAEALDRYHSRTEVESVFKTSKEYIGLLPLSKWSDLTVRGKILHDTIATIALLQVRRAMAAAGATWSVSDLWGKSSALMCYRSGGSLMVETPTKQVRERWGALGVKVPAKVDVGAFRKDVLGLSV